MKFPTLYKRTSTGAIQFWQIESDEYDGIGMINTLYGQLGTDSPQTTADYIEKGKNVGKKNETSPGQQAEAEAKAKWIKQTKKGYVDSIEKAETGELDEVIEGGIEPMLAYTFEKHGKKIKYPCYVQGKYDGTRLIAIVNEGIVTLWSRTRKPVKSLPHLVKEIESLSLPDGTVLDGEAYNSKFHDNFEHIIHLVRQDEPDAECTDVEYHVYDLASEGTFASRYKTLERYIKNTQYLKLVPTYLVESEDQVVDYYNKFKDEGLEGAMLRNANGLYVNKRSYDLVKVKEMQDAEFEITGIEEGRGKLAGHVGAFICKIGDQEFKAKMSGNTNNLKKYFEDHSLWTGKQLTVKYQDLTSYGIPRFPVGLRIRETE
jgi:DNA ligase-1